MALNHLSVMNRTVILRNEQYYRFSDISDILKVLISRYFIINYGDIKPVHLATVIIAKHHLLG